VGGQYQENFGMIFETWLHKSAFCIVGYFVIYRDLEGIAKSRRYSRLQCHDEVGKELLGHVMMPNTRLEPAVRFFAVT
jgi:hypothetical protein